MTLATSLRATASKLMAKFGGTATIRRVTTGVYNPTTGTPTEPQAPNLKLAVATVLSSKNNGAIFVRWDTGRRLQDLHDVEASGGKDDRDVLNWNAAAARWEPTDRLTLLEQRVAALENLLP